MNTQPSTRAELQRSVNVIVDTPMGSRHKFKLDETSGFFKLAHTFRSGRTIRMTSDSFRHLPGDGDPLDVMIIDEAPTFAGCLIDVCLIGVFEAQVQHAGKTLRNDRPSG